MSTENDRSLKLLSFVEDTEEISGLNSGTRSPETSLVLEPLFLMALTLKHSFGVYDRALVLF